MKQDCKHFNGYKPCAPHKICSKCVSYHPVKTRILIIKRGAAGEVLRCTPILHKLKTNKFTHITWITDYPELANNFLVDEVLKFNYGNCEYLEFMEFDDIYSLDKERDSCVLAEKINFTRNFKGYKLHPVNNCITTSYNANLYRKGLDDDFMKASTTHYVEDLFELCCFKFNEERYVMPHFPNFSGDYKKASTKLRIGLNTGAGNTWKPRQLSKIKWLRIALKLEKLGYEVVLLGGLQEDAKNEYIACRSNAKYYGIMSMIKFISLVNTLQVMVTAPTFALHVAIGLGIRIVILNNTFNIDEFYTYNICSIKLQPDIGCLACYKQDFDNKCETKNCMDHIPADLIVKSIKELGGFENVS